MKHLLFFAFLIMQMALEAQESSISGSVRNEASGEGIPGVTLLLTPGEHWAVTAADGSFNFPQLKAGNYHLEVTALGFESYSAELQLKEGEEQKLLLRLNEDIYKLPGLEVSGISLTNGMTGSYALPGNGFYLSPKRVQAFRDFDINNQLKEIPGVYFQEEDGFGLRPNIGMRGTGSERSQKITIMEDGVLAAPAPYSAPAAYYFPTFARMYSMELLRGSSQIRFGPYTTGGAINLISTPIPAVMKAGLSMEGGSYGFHRLHSFAGNSHKNMAYLVEGHFMGSNGFKRLPGAESTGFEKSDFLAKVRFNTAPDRRIYQSITLKAAWMSENSNESYLGISEADFEHDPFQRYAASARDLMQAEQRQLSALYKLILSKNAEIAAVAYRNDFSRNWYKLDKIIVDGEALSISRIFSEGERERQALYIARGDSSGELLLKANNRSYVSQGIQANAAFSLRSGKFRHKWLIGSRLHYDRMDRFQQRDRYRIDQYVLYLTDKGAPGSESNRIVSALAWSGFMQYTLRFKGLTLVPGLRLESSRNSKMDYGPADPDRSGEDLQENHNHAFAWIPGIGMDYQMKRGYSLFAGVHRGYSPPGTQAGARPESSVNYELGLRKSEGLFQSQLTLWLHDFSNLLGSDLAASGGSGLLYNGGAVLARGAEFNISYDLRGRSRHGAALPVSLIYSYTKAHFLNSFESDYEPWGTVQAGDELPYIPTHTLTLQSAWQSATTRLELRFNYQSAMRSRAGSGPLMPSYATEAHFTLDASVHQRLNKHFTIYLSGNNLTNSVYIAARRPAGVRPGAPRILRLGLSADL